MSYSLFADEGVDFNVPTGVATFPAGAMTGVTDYISVTTIQDDHYEGTHTFMVMPVIQSGPAVAAAVTCPVVITEDDGMQA